MKEIMQKFALAVAVCLWVGAASAATGKTEAFPLDLREGERVSAFDSVSVHDGEGHTIDTNGLAEAFAAVVGDGFAVSDTVNEGAV